MPHLDLSRFHKFDELTAYLQAVAAEYPHLTVLDTIGKSHQGRDIWVMTVTNGATGPAHEKPGYWIDANIHAGEVTGGATCLYTIQHLTTQYGRDDLVTRLLDQHALYIAPRLTPDGTEHYLTTPDIPRSSVRPYPFADDREGLHAEDINGDGLILEMRVPDPKGAWKVSDRDPRLLRPREFHDHGGQYYHRYVEGRIRDYNRYTFQDAPPRFGLDLNRNFPHGWAPESSQRGAGPFPLSEPETRAVSDFFATHRNINGVQSYHTFSGVILRPYAGQSDDAFPTHDLTVYKRFGKRGTEITGYPNTSVYHGFRYDPKATLSGGFFDWLYDHLGVIAFANELWDVIAEAGVKDRDFIGWFREHPEEDDLKLLAFNDQHGLGGFHDWAPFDHPQLGRVEIGGWDYKRFWQNAPAQFLPDIAHKNMLFTLEHALASPRLNVKHSEVQRVEAGVYRVIVVLENLGYLPTYTSAKARERQAVEPIRVTLDLPGEAQLISGKRTFDAGQLEGRSGGAPLFGPGGATLQERKLEWIVRAPEGTTVSLTAAGQRAGTARATLTLHG